MRIDVKKFLFIGVREDRDRFFQQAQELGAIHFIEVGKQEKDLGNIQEMTTAIKVLRGLPLLPQEELEEYALADGLAHKILQLKHKLEKLEEERRTLRMEISRISIFGDFSKEDLAFIEREGHRKVQFYFGKHGVRETVQFPEEVLYIGSEHELDYFMAINTQPTSYDKLVEIRIDLPLGELKRKIVEVEKELHSTEQRLKTYARYNTFLHHALIGKLNKANLLTAQENAQPALNDSLFAVTGWIPINKIETVKELVSQMSIYITEVAIEPIDNVPTYLENRGISRIGEDIIGIYDTPSPTDKDPSLWVLVSFALFFSIIVGDAGYGLIFLGISLYLRYKFTNLHGFKQRFLNLIMILSFSVIAWGVLTTSFFGMTVAPDSPIQKVSIIHWLAKKKAAYHIAHQDTVYEEWVKKFPQLQNVTDPEEFLTKGATISSNRSPSFEVLHKFTDTILLELALLIGVIHVIISFLRYINRNWLGLGWIAAIIGAYLYIPYYLHGASIPQIVFDFDQAIAARNGLYLMAGGISFTMIGAIIKFQLLGLTEIMNAIQIFSDIMSYLRLYALGLSGAIVTTTIKEAAAAAPLVAAILLLIVGHAINITLCVMSGVIHGLRLNFLEWYHYSFQGGGKPFKPLHKLHIE